MAKQPQNQEQTLLTDLATKAEVLHSFILDPEAVMKKYNIRDKHTRDKIRNTLALEVAKKLVVYPSGGLLHWG